LVKGCSLVVAGGLATSDAEDAGRTGGRRRRAASRELWADEDLLLIDTAKSILLGRILIRLGACEVVSRNNVSASLFLTLEGTVSIHILPGVRGGGLGGEGVVLLQALLKPSFEAPGF
jgi:hypothetical protein